MSAEINRPWMARYKAVRFMDVLRAETVTPLMRRITLGGPEMAGFTRGPNIKLIVPPAGLKEMHWPSAAKPIVWPDEAVRPAVRTYSVRRLDIARGELDIDFVLHGHGAAAGWAAAAGPGHVCAISVPGGRDIAPAAWSCVAGDHTALPAIMSILERMPRDAQGHAVIEVPGAAEEQQIDAPPGVTVTWLHARPERSRLVEVVTALRWPDHDDVAFWVGCESEAARALRAYARDDRKVDRRRLLAISYWKRGLTETAFKEAHDHDRDADYFAVAREEHERAHAVSGSHHRKGERDHGHVHEDH